MASAAGALIAAAVAVAASPYLARLTVTVPDKELPRWWRGAAPGPGRLAGTALAALVLGGLGGAAAGLSALLPAFVLYALAGAPLVVIDYDLHRLPNRLVLPWAAGAAVLLALAAVQDGAWHHLLRAAEAAAAVFAALFALILAAPGGFGYGDVKLGGIVAGYLGWFGWADVFYGVFAGFVLGAVVALALLASRRGTMKSQIAFGPMLMLGPVIVLALDLVPRMHP